MNRVDDMLASIERAYRDTASWTGLSEPSPRVLDAMRRVPRERYVPFDQRRFAYDDRALDIGRGQTISQPFIVALMTDLCAIEAGTRVLEIGTGSGYQAAILAELGAEVWSIELDEPLGRSAAHLLDELGYHIHLRIGDGRLGWPEAAPFDRIVATAAGPTLPPAWIEQLEIGGSLVAPLGPPGGDQMLELVEKQGEGQVARRVVLPVRFVPLRHD
ncbi:MAG: protein-L-isoaspartate(D-aspartate) O-methyltransferase [Planctomycetota bacterium]